MLNSSVSRIPSPALCIGDYELTRISRLLDMFREVACHPVTLGSVSTLDTQDERARNLILGEHV